MAERSAAKAPRHPPREEHPPVCSAKCTSKVRLLVGLFQQACDQPYQKKCRTVARIPQEAIRAVWTGPNNGGLAPRQRGSYLPSTPNRPIRTDSQNARPAQLDSERREL